MYIYAIKYTCIYIKFIREATESAQPDWELDVQQRSYFVLMSLNCRNIMFLSKVLNWRPGAKIKFIREATESAQPDWELDVQQRSYFVLITIVSMYGISNTSHQIRYKV